MTASRPKAVLETRYEVTPLELLFDLVFVFGISQLSLYLLAHLSLKGAVETTVMMLAILTVWSYTSWAATMIPADRLETHWMTLAVMLVGLFMNAAVTGAFGRSGWAFVIPFLLNQFGRTFWTIAYSPDAFYRDHFVRVLIWLFISLPFWMTGAGADPDVRILWWGGAMSIDLIGTWLAHPVPGRWLQSEGISFDSDHILERCRLFLLIALGEAVYATGAAIAEAPMDLLTFATGSSALIVTVALWSLTFGRVHRLVNRYAEETSDPIRASRHAINATTLMVAGLIAVAVANRIVIDHPFSRATGSIILTLCGGLILFLFAQGWYLWTVPKVRPWLQIAGCAVLMICGLCFLFVLPYVMLIVVAASLAILAIVDVLTEKCA